MALRGRGLELPEELGELDEELIIRPRRMAEQDTGIDITPMIDITFLLLVFFLVASTIARQTAVDLPEAQLGDAVATQQSVVVTIAPDGADGAIIFTGDGVNEAWRLTSTDPVTQEEELAAYIQSEFDNDALKRHVMIKAGKTVKHRHVARVSHAAGRVLTTGRLYVAVLEGD